MQTGLVSAVYRAHYEVLISGTRYHASVRGHFHQLDKNDLPKVGDRVAVELLGNDQAVITEVLPRRNRIARWSEYDGASQVMVTNIDYVLIVIGLDNDFNIARLQRYLALASQSEVSPVIICNKQDLAADFATQRAQVEDVARETPVHYLTAETGKGIEELMAYISDGCVAVLLGSSGAGKSTIINQLLDGQAQRTQQVRERDDRGRHTTTRRQLFVTAAGGYVIDTPGIRELALLDDAAAAAEQFADIAVLASHCQFRNCDHEKSAGCAIQAALQAGAVDETRVRQFFKLQRSETRLRRIRTR